MSTLNTPTVQSSDRDMPLPDLTAAIEAIETMPLGNPKDDKHPETRARLQASSRLVGQMYRLGMIERWTIKQHRRTNLGDSAFEDLVQNASVHLIRTLATREAGWLRSRTGNAFVVCYHLVGSAATLAAENYSERYGIAGATNVFRRNQKYRVAEARLARELGRTPTEAEVLEKLNLDPRVGVREARWDGINHRLPEMAGEILDHEGATADESDVALTAAHATSTIASTVRIAHPGRPELIQTLNAWFQGLTSGLISPDDDRVEVVALMLFGTPIDATTKRANETETAERFDAIDGAVAAYRDRFGGDR